ncbi:MAG: hypothetical protein ABII00_06905 [Elusimicrobiota bacterium]
MDKKKDKPERYWLSRKKRVTGPFEREELVRLEGFSADSLVCPEDTFGSAAEEWRRAAEAGGLSSLFPPSLRGKRERPADDAAASGRKEGPWPPDPARRDVDPIGSVEDRMEIVDRSLSAAQRKLVRRQEAFRRLKAELANRIQTAEELEQKIRQMAASMGGFLGMRAEIDQAKAAMLMQHRRIEELHEQLRTVREEGREEARKRPPAREAAPSGKAREPSEDPFGATDLDPASGPEDLGLPEVTFQDDVPDLGA